MTEDDIKSLPCFQVLVCWLVYSENCNKILAASPLQLLLPYIRASYMQNETLIAIKAPHGTTLEVPDPDEVRRGKVLAKIF